MALLMHCAAVVGKLGGLSDEAKIGLGVGLGLGLLILIIVIIICCCCCEWLLMLFAAHTHITLFSLFV